jgi:excinuclease ABC subunit B
MREAAADLDFEEAARLRDEVKRLRATELAVVDDPTAKYPSSSPRALRAPSPRLRGEDGGEGQRAAAARSNGPRKPTLDEMGPGPESAPYRGPRSTLGKPGMRGGFKPKRRH